ncbi:pyruvoyl-dependent arginine decarboxylase [Candidatus Woesearchaeota archaeon]|nr:pyruvoyl-dependent arginine decarboxylase [Candidatus Woesearchaeota archaeon]
MNLYVTWGVGQGPTKLAAYDKAGFKAGIPNYNLIRMSCIIPSQSQVTIKQLEPDDSKYGDKLYVVLSEKRTSKIGEEVYAGIGWRLRKDDNRGLFVEHTGHSESEVRDKLEKSLDYIIDFRAWKNVTKTQSKICGIKCIDKPVCALVAAIYQFEKWNG